MSHFRLETGISKRPILRTCQNRITNAQNALSSASSNILGEFDFSEEKLQNTISVLPPQDIGNRPPKIGSRQINDIYAVSTGYRKSCYRFGAIVMLHPNIRGFQSETRNQQPNRNIVWRVNYSFELVKCASDFLAFEYFDHIPSADIAVVFERHTAFLTRLNFGHFVLVALQRL